MTQAVHLLVETGPRAGARFVLTEPTTFWIGRDPACQLSLGDGDPAVSRFHALLAVDPPEVGVRDAGSRTGTGLDGARLGGRARGVERWDACEQGLAAPWIEARPGSTLDVGDTRVRVALPGGAPPRSCARCHLVLDAATGAATSPARCEACASLAPTADEELRLALGIEEAGPVWLSHFDLGALLGKAGMGVVHRATRRRDGAALALKLVPSLSEADLHARLQAAREITVMRALAHPRIVRVEDHGAYRRRPSASILEQGLFYTMEICEGGSLFDRLKAHGPLPFAQLRDTLRDVLDALAFAHAHPGRFVHRDIKPGNILLDAPGGFRAKLADFGISKSAVDAGASSLTDVPAPKGTWSFMPPEQQTRARWATPASDVFSVAATFLRATTGRGHEQARAAHPHLPPAVAAVLDKALRFQPEDRFADAVALRAALAPHL